jgi:transcriptional regulator with XRE-family HTH domain
MIILLRPLKWGRRCHVLRAYKGISAEYMAKKTLISKYRYSRFENGWCRLSEEEERLVAQVLGVVKEELFSPVLISDTETHEDTL